MKTDITDAHSKGKINELHYNSLKNEISILYEEIFKKKIEFLSVAPNQNSRKELFSQLKDDIEMHIQSKKLQISITIYLIRKYKNILATVTRASIFPQSYLKKNYDY